MEEKEGNVNMKRIELIRLTVENFKGIRHLKLDLGGQSASIYGDNASGKTSVYDALTWLLFGKDSHGQGTFDIKPLGQDGQVADHMAITAVEAILGTECGPVELRKTYYEKWSTKRGSATETFDGNTSDFFVDGVPVKKYEFERRVADLVPEDVFRLLTGVTYFCGELDWKERRKVLFDLCAVASDAAIMGMDPRFSALLESVGRLGLDDYKKKLGVERKGLMGVRNDLPTRLDECQKTVEDLSGIDFHAIRAERDGRAAEKARLAEELMRLDHNTLLDAKRNELGKLKNDLEKVEHENTVYRQSQVVHEVDIGAALRRELDGLERDFARKDMERSAALRDGARWGQEIEACRSRWKEENAREFTGGTCPTCGQPLTGDMLERAVAQFDREKAARLDRIVGDSKVYKDREAEAKGRYEDVVEAMVLLENRIAEVKDKLAAAKPVEQPEIVDAPTYAADKKALVEAMASVEREIAALAGESTTISRATQDKLTALSAEIATLDSALAKESLLDFTRDRMEKLREEANRAAEQLEKLDKMLFLCDEFTRYKVAFIEDSINSRFSMVRFKLFSEQVNGGLADCCEATVDGIPYTRNLNSGAKINAGMDVISTLSDFYGVKVPLFVDNAESVTAIYPMDTQVIRLVVSAGDKDLRCEYGA